MDYETYGRNGFTVRLWHDEFAGDDGPADWGNFSIVQFRDRDYTTYSDLDDYLTENGFLKPSIKAKLRAGKMFTFSYRSYSGTDGGFYTLDGSIPTDDDLDSQDINGFIVFDDAYIKDTTFEQRKQYAISDLKEYTAWANGEVYGWTVETPDGEVLDSCGGYIGSDSDEYMRSEANAAADSYRGSYLAKPAQALHK